MTTPSRDGPCGCGSGLPQVACCRAGEEAASVRPSFAWLPGPATGALGPERGDLAFGGGNPGDLPGDPGGGDEAGDDPDWDPWDALFRHIERAPVELKISVARAAIEDGKVDPLSLLDAVEAPLRRAGKVVEYDGLVELIRGRFPDRTADGRHVLLERRIENVLLLPGMSATPLLLELVKDPGSDLDGLLNLVDWLRYHGRTDELLPILPAVLHALGNTLLDDWVLYEFCQMAVHACLEAELARARPETVAAALETALDPALLARVAPFCERFSLDAKSLLAALVGQPPRRARREDFSPHQPSERLASEVSALGIDFGFELRARHGWTGTRAELAQLELVGMLRSRLPVTPPPSSVRRRITGPLVAPIPGALGAPARPSVLVVEPAECAAHLRVSFSTPHRAASLFAALVPWVSFLAQRGLVESTTARDWRAGWAGRCPDLSERFADAADPVLAEDARAVCVALAGER